jgi:hypothetical protein
VPLLLLLATAAAVAAPLEMRVDIAQSRFLRVELVARGSKRVLVTPRTTLGCYIEVAVWDSTGNYIGWFGPRANCPTPAPADFQMLGTGTADVADADGAALFGVEIDILVPERVRFRDDGGEVGKLQPGHEYRLVVTYHNNDAETLDVKAKQTFERKYGPFVAPRVLLTSGSIPFRVPA